MPWLLEILQGLSDWEGVLVTLDELEKLCNEATPGPWRKTSDILTDAGCVSTRTEDLFRSYGSPTIQISRDCDFIAAARTYLPRLLAVAKAAKVACADHDLQCEDSNGTLGALAESIAALES